MKEKNPNEFFFSATANLSFYYDKKSKYSIKRFQSENHIVHLLLSKLILSKFLSQLKLEEDKNLDFIYNAYSFYPSQPLLYYRFALTYLSYLYIFNGDENKARKALEQTEKRCVIKDFWRWIIKENYPMPYMYELYEENWPYADSPLNIIIFFKEEKVPIIIPHWDFMCKKEEHYLSTWEFTLKGWEKTEAQKYYSQGEVERTTHNGYASFNQDIEGSYNMETCQIEKCYLDISNDYGYEKGLPDDRYGILYTNDNGYISLAALPLRLSAFLVNFFFELKVQINNESLNEDSLIRELRKELKRDKKTNIL